MIVDLRAQIAVVHYEVRRWRALQAAGKSPAADVQVIIWEAVEATLNDAAMRCQESKHEGP
jgi:hypothetical protein